MLRLFETISTPIPENISLIQEQLTLCNAVATLEVLLAVEWHLGKLSQHMEVESKTLKRRIRPESI